MPPCLTLSIIRYGSRVKWSNPGKGVAPSPTHWCSKLSKREPSGHPWLWSPTLLLYIYTYIYIYFFFLPRRDCFVVSQIFRVARHVRCFKLGSKPGQRYVSRFGFPWYTIILSVSEGLCFTYISIYIYIIGYRRAQFMRRALHLRLCGTIYQPLRSGRVWHKVNF